ncbi:MAG: DUF4097 family beta strand repeat protein [Acidobacteriaceae bacterium]|nr:DUF4097 family beta strand repeat protein [Acidobacteriaceae bacterium]MBV9500040.1 DUF4097 family beta strand repeat protein [Acidobacteriaceae bacterium]
MNRAAITVCITGLFLVSGIARADEWNKHWSVGTKPEIYVRAGDAAIRVEASDNGSVTATLRTRGLTIGPSGVHVIDHQTGNRIEIEIKEPVMHWGWGVHSIQLDLRVPTEMAGELHTGDGSIDLRGVHGALQVETGDGSVRGEDLDGSLDAHSGDGSMNVTGRFDNLQVRTSDGSVDVEVRQGSRIQSDWRVQTGDGSVRLNLPRSLSADLRVKTGDGHVQVNLPVTVMGEQNGHEVNGRLNGGGSLITVHTGDGSVTINPLPGT